MTAARKPLVMKYLKQNGFPFEMKVAAEFQKKGFGIHQSIYYTDIITKVSREIDLLAMWHGKINDISFNILFVIECKYANLPWVVFSSITKGVPTCYVDGGRGYNWLNHLVKQPGFETFFEIEQSYSYGIAVATLNKKSKDQNKSIKANVSHPPKAQENIQPDEVQEEGSVKENAYKAMQSVIGFLKSEVEHPMFSTLADYSFFVPIIAIRGELFKAFIDDDAEIDCSEIKEAQILYKENIKGAIPKIHIITEDILESYIEKLRADCEKLFTLPYRNEAIAVPVAPRYVG